MAVLAAVTAAVLGFTRAWDDGVLVIDGPGTVMWARLVAEHAAAGGVPYWVGDVWTGTPAWALGPSFPLVVLVPLVRWLGPERAVEVASLASIVVGGVGAYALVQTWWHERWASIVAAFLYALNPLVLSHQGLFGLEPVGWVLAATPWFVLATRGALRVGGGRRVTAAAATGAFAVLHQAEHAYYLAAFAAALVLAEVGRALATRRHESGVVETLPVDVHADDDDWIGDPGVAFPVLRGAAPAPQRDRPTAGAVLRRAAAVAGLTVGLIAFWLLPLLALADAFVLTPTAQVERELELGAAAEFGAHPEGFVTRMSVPDDGFPPLFRPEGGAFYLGGAALVLAAAALPLLRRGDEGGSVTAVATSGLVVVWLSTAGVPLAESAPARAGAVAGFIGLGLVLGFIGASIVSRLRHPAAQTAALLVVVAGVALVPIATPFTALREVLPLLQHVRFPRLYPGGVLAVVLLAGFVLAAGESRLRAALPRRGGVVAGAVAAVLIGVVALDAAPYQRLFRLHPPPDDARLTTLLPDALRREDGVVRVGTPVVAQPAVVEALERSGFPLASGWPHPLADPGIWRLTGATQHSPPDYAVRAMGVVAATHVVTRGAHRPAGSEPVGAAHLTRTPYPLPFARIARAAVVLDDATLAPELATGLAGSAVAVVEGGSAAVASLGDVPHTRVPAAQACDATSDAALHDGTVAGQLARACALAPWVTSPSVRAAPVERTRTVGVVLTVAADDLQGLAFDLDREDPGPTRLHLHVLDDEGHVVGDDLADVGASFRDADGLWVYRFPPVPHPAGTRMLAVLECEGCPAGLGPWLRGTDVDDGDGDLVVDGIVLPDRVARFAPVHGRPTEAGQPPPLEEQAAQAVDAEALGRDGWRVRANLERPALLVVAVSAFPGWEATVDGEPAPVLRADGGLVAVPLGEGTSEVVLRYPVPDAARAGRAVTATAVALAALALVVPRGLVRRLAATARDATARADRRRR